MLDILSCPKCRQDLQLDLIEEDSVEVRRGRLLCTGGSAHAYEIDDGIVRFRSGFDREQVRKEIDYEDSTYTGDARLRDREIISGFPDTLETLWPHTRHFGPDFRELIDRVEPGEGGWVLDVGTAACWSTRLLAQRPSKAIALDVSDSEFYGLRTADILFKKHGVYFDRVLESMTDLPFRDSCLDVITFNASFHHTPDLPKTLAECFRTLRPGGRAAMVNEEFYSLRHRLGSARKPVTDTGSHHAISHREFDHAARRAGFEPRYYLAAHVRAALKNRLPSPLGTWAASLFDGHPFLTQQLNSALIVLSKPGH